MKVRYTGLVPAHFQPGNRQLEPGQEFDVPAAHAPRYLRHGLIEPVDDEAIGLAAELDQKGRDKAASRHQKSEPEDSTPTRTRARKPRNSADQAD